MRLKTPKSLHYPLTVTKLFYKPNDHIDQHAPIFAYVYKSKVLEGDKDNPEGKLVERTWPSTFESYAEGELIKWDIHEGSILYQPGLPIAELEEACGHEVQFGNMCADCGKDMTTVTYNTYLRDTDRATVNAVHGHTALLVSHGEASRSDEEAKRRLLSSRKLSLVVDLDQTIIQATVDPTVAEWQKDPQNPNYPAVKHVRKFQLIDEGPGARGCWYYIKFRPGLQEFLSTISKYYELHIYTMGTRAYAQNIAKLVDPDRKIFADRILSRDESGSLTVKNLKRLFPVDTKMVVIIDDRGDVWHWSQNLIKVTPYDFFVGIGDINSSFLPKRPGLEATPPKPATPDAPPTSKSNPAPSAQTEPTTDGISAIDQLVTMGGGNDPSKLKEQTSEQDEAIAAQLADRPLLQKQKILDAAEEGSNGLAEPQPESEAAPSADSPAEPQSKYRHNLLQDNDTELRYLQQSLQTVHSAFFDEYDRQVSGPQDGRVAELRPGHNRKLTSRDLDNLPDVTSIMASMKKKVLKGVYLVFSGVFPLGVNPQSHDLAIWAKSFGARVSENITKRTTHVVASPLRKTAKVRQAAKKLDRINIVSQDWLFGCLSQWQRIDEGPFRLHSDLEDAEQNTNQQGSPFDAPEQDARLSSSDEEAAVTEEDDDSETTNGSGFDTDNEQEMSTHRPQHTKEETEEKAKEIPTDWGALDEELSKFLGEVDSDSEAESTISTGTAETEPRPSNAKRKRDEDGLTTDDDESDSSQTGGSRLQRRKKKALARTTSLASVSAITDSQKNMAESNSNGQQNIANTEDAAEDDEDADLEAQLEAEMLRQEMEDGDT